MLTVYGLTGTVEPLIGVPDLERVREVNGDRSITFSVTRVDANAEGFELLENESVVETEDGERYRVKDVSPETKGNRMAKKVKAQHIFFDIIDSKVTREDTRNGSFSVDSMLSFVLSRAGWTFVIESGNYYAESWENFGGDNCLKLFNELVDRYNFEYFPKASEKKVYIYGQLGYTTDVQIRYNHNLKALKANFNTDNLSTIGTAYGKAVTDEEGKVLSQIKATFRHPNADIFGERWAPDWEDQRYTTTASLSAAIASKLIADPEFSLEADYVELVRNGMKLYEFNEGDDLFVIHERYGFDLLARVLKIVDYPYSGGKKQPKLTISNLRKNVKDRLSQTIRRSIEAQKNALSANNKAVLSEIKANTAIVNAANQKARLDPILDANGNMTTASRRLYMNSNVYADHRGLWMVDPNDPTRYAFHGAGGSDYIKGMIRIVRPDGFEVMNDGITKFDVNIQGSTPSFTSPQVEHSGWWFKTFADYNRDCDFFTYKHTARYLKIMLGVRADSGGTTTISIEDTDYNVLATYSTQESDTNNLITLNVDMGIPTGKRAHFYLRFRTNNTNYAAYVRIRGQWLEG